MNFKPTLVAMAIIPFCSQAGIFSMPTDLDKGYNCKKCQLETSNELTVLTEQSTHLDSQYGISGKLKQKHLSIDADRAGADNGELTLGANYHGLSLELGYRNLWQLDDNDIGTERDRISGELAYELGLARAYINASSEEKNGQKVSSYRPDGGQPTNFLRQIDHTTQVVGGGVDLNGSFWHLGVNAMESDFQDNLGLDADNRAQRASVTAGVSFAGTQIRLQGAEGKMIQDDAIVQDTNLVPITNFDGEVETLDYDALMLSRIGSSRIKAYYRFSERDNVSGSYEFFEGINQPIDTEKTRYGAEFSQRLAQFKLTAGFEQEDKTRSQRIEETTEEQTLFARVDYRNHGYKAHLKFEDGDRSGSQDRLDEQPYHKFDKADRTRTGAELGLGFANNTLGWQLTAKLADSDYANHSALKSTSDQRFDASVWHQATESLRIQTNAGLQTIDSEELHQTEVQDEFIYAGFSVTGYHLTPSLLAGLDYQFAFSGSDTLVGTSEYGDYYQYTHQAEVYLDKQISSSISTRLSYGYERHYDTNYANQPIDSVITLADLNQNYIDHKVGIYFTIKL